MSPKRVPAQPALTVPPKRTIRGPSQSLRSPSTGQASGRLQSLVSSLAGDPAALARFASEVDGLIQRCSAGPSQQPAVTTAAAVSSASDSASSDENDLPMSGVLFSDSQFSRNVGSAPASSHTQEGRTPSRRATGRGRREKAPSRRGGSSRPGSALQPLPSTSVGSDQSPATSSQSVPGAALQGPASESSEEDSLPVPAKSSLGGTRRRKKSSRKRAKRGRRDTSSSSGTSSGTSESESEASSEFYWGLGEAASRFPKWVWERRANSHRAKYGATQEYLNGVLLPDIKKSTNSARDVIPGCHLSKKLRTRILNGRYVDMFKLSPPVDSSQAQEKSVLSSKKRAADSKVDRTFDRWLDCFQVFAGIVSACYPKRAVHLIVYQSIVRKAFEMAGQNAAFDYDENFRRRAAKIPTARWDRRDLDVWTTYVAPQFEKKTPEPQKPKTGGFKKRLYCWDYSKGSCQRQSCRFPHVCEKCGGNHPGYTCFGSRRPFRGGKGGSQAAKAPPPQAAAGASK